MRNWRAGKMLLPSGVAWFGFALAALAQDESLKSLIEIARTATQAGNWEQALAANAQAVAMYGKDKPLEKYGAQFGAIYYRKGQCEIKLRQWKEALRSFEICYRDFPNRGTTASTANPFQKLALLKWGEAAMGAGDYKLAEERFLKFSAERDKTRDTFPQGSFYINLAICQYHLGRIPEGSDNFEIALKNKLNFPTPAEGIIAAFQALAEAALEKRNEQALLDFIAKNRGDLAFDRGGNYIHAQVFMKLAGDAIGTGMQQAAMSLYQLVPATDVAIDDLKAAVEAMGTAASVQDGESVIDAKSLTSDLAAFEADRKSKRPMEAIKLAAVAFLHESAGNVTGAYAAYLQLERYHAGAEDREENLYNLTRLSAKLGDGPGTRGHAERYIKDFPGGARLGTIGQMMISSYYQQGDYTTCIREAARLLSGLEPGTPAHDEVLFVLAASHFHSGEYKLALPLLQKHAAAYPKSEAADAALYFQAVAQARLGNPQDAGRLLDRFLTENGADFHNPYVPGALYERAGGLADRAAALATLDDLTTRFPADPFAVKGHLLAGKLRQDAKDFPNAEKSYLAAVDQAAVNHHLNDGGEALLRLIYLITSQAKDDAQRKRAAPHADRFWKEFAEGSPWKSQVAIAGVPAYSAAGRTDEALQHLRDAIIGELADPRSREIGQLANRYASLWLQAHPAGDLRRQFEGIPGFADSKILQQSLSLAVIRSQEQASRDAKSDESRQTSQEKVRALYRQLKTDHPIGELSDEALVKLGNHLRTTSTPREALGFYNEAIHRGDPAFRNEALLGRADVAAQSAVPAEIKNAIADFRRVAAESGDPGERDYARFREVALVAGTGDPVGSIDLAKAYLNNPGVFGSEVKLLLADSYLATAKGAEALPLYLELSASEHELWISARAIVAWARLAAERADRPELRQDIYEELMKFLAATREASKATGPGVLANWMKAEELANSLALDPAIKPVPQSRDNPPK